MAEVASTRFIVPRIDRGVSFDDWILALHVLSAFAYVAGIDPLLGPDRRRAQDGHARRDDSAWSRS